MCRVERVEVCDAKFGAWGEVGDRAAPRVSDTKATMEKAALRRGHYPMVGCPVARLFRWLMIR